MRPDKQLNEKFIEGSEIKILEFECKDLQQRIYQLALNIQKVKEVVEFRPLQSLPENFHPFIGIVNLRKTPVPVLDLLSIFGQQNHAQTYTSDDRIIICDFQRMLVGIIVSKTKRVETYPNDRVLAQPAAIDTIQKHFFNGLIQKDHYAINLLDIEFILNSFNVNLGSKTEVLAKDRFKGKTVLIAEDSKFFQKKIEKLFQKMGFIITMAEDGQDALNKLAKLNYKVDLVFTDIEMPNMNGIGMVRKLKHIEEAKNLPIIFNTSLSNPTLRDDIMNDQLGNLIVKFDEEEIFKELTKVFS